MEGELHLDRRKKNHLGNKSLGAFWKETWVGPDQDAVVWPDLCSKQHRNMSFQKEILSPQFPLSPRKYHAGENASFGVLPVSFGQLGTPALQTWKQIQLSCLCFLWFKNMQGLLGLLSCEPELCLWCGAISSWGLRGSHGLPGGTCWCCSLWAARLPSQWVVWSRGRTPLSW